MKTCLSVARPILLVFFSFACSSTKEPGQSKNHKFFVLPVNLSITGIERDTSIRRIFEEAFSKYKIQLITDEELKISMEKEGNRIGQKVFRKDSKFNNAEDILNEMSREHRYVVNRLSVNLELHDKDDSLMIEKVWWTNTPFPPNFSRVYITKKREINLADLPHSIKENVNSIVDSILYSKELK